MNNNFNRLYYLGTDIYVTLKNVAGNVHVSS